MSTVKLLLDEKGHDVWCIGTTASVYDAVALMAEKGVGALVVTENEKPVGMISERDYARKVILKGRSSADTLIKDIMSTRIVYTRPERSVEECMALMTEKRIRHLPVMKDDELVGLVSLGDLVKTIMAEQKFIIEQLEHYISS